MDLLEFEQLLDKIIQQNGFSKTIQDIIFPFFERIGVLWQAGSIFVTHEHFVSNLVRKHLIVQTAQFEPSKKQTILFFLHDNEMHELGLLYLNYLAAENGLRCVYLGQNVPFNDLAQLLSNCEYDFICASFIYAFEKQPLEQYLANLSKVFHKNKILITGRQVLIQKPHLPTNVVYIKNNTDFIKKINK
jgi:methanogenic corrinoid protein MtbC1